jgi:hypothetical protein
MDALADTTATTVKKGPRAAETYRGHVRNTWKAARRLPEWREKAAAIANQNANLAGRAAQANAAREAAAAALVQENVRQTGLGRDVLATSAMLAFYRGEKRTRPVNRIIRELKRQVRSAGAML